MRRLDHTGANTTLDRVVQCRSGDASRVLHHTKIEFASDDRSHGEHITIGSTQLGKPTPHQIEHTVRQTQLGHRMPVPAILVPPDVAFVHQRAERLDDQQRIPFRLPVEVREELALDLLSVESGVDPASQFVARQSCERLLVDPPIVRPAYACAREFPA